jgi:hypothetical protein
MNATVFRFSVAVAALAALPLLAIGQEAKPKTQLPKAPKTAPPTAEEIARLTAPGPEHEKLAKLVGQWDVSVVMGARAAAPKSQGEATIRTTTGGRFLFIEFAAKGQAGPVEGTFTIGYDTRHEHFTLIATDNYGVYFVTSQGKRDDKTGKLRLYGSDDDPMMKAMGLTKEFVHAIDIRDENQLWIEIFFIDTRTERRAELEAMEYVFMRKEGEAK